MVAYFILMLDLTFDDVANVWISSPGPIDQNVLTVVYSVILVLIDYAFRAFAISMTEGENCQYQTSFDSRLSFRFFVFNFFVYFLPLFWSAFDTRNPDRYYALTYLVFTTMVIKQIAINLMEKYLPVFLIKPALDKIRGKFWDIRMKFLDEEK